MIKGALSALAAVMAIGLALASYSAASAPAYVGSDGCNCHMEQSEEWAASSHGKAFDSLLAAKRSKAANKAMTAVGLDPGKDYDTDPGCLACHATGFGKPGGYDLASKNESLKGVGCESCHGPGSLYRVIHEEKAETFTKAEVEAAGQTPKPDEKVCRRCHDVDSSVFSSKVDPKYGFDFNKRIGQRKAWHQEYELFFDH